MPYVVLIRMRFPCMTMKKDRWINKRWAINGNDITEVKCGKDIEGATVQEALDRFHITPFVEASEMRKEGYVRIKA